MTGPSSPPPLPRGDMLAGPADYIRPANPWPRLIAFGLGILAIVLLAGLCVASYASPPDREIRVRDTEFQPGQPKFLAIQAFGADGSGGTYGAYLAIPSTGTGGRAFLSRDPESGCNLRWDASATVGGVTGALIDPCSDARYSFDGVALHPNGTVDLHEFSVRREANSYVVMFETLTLGACRGDHTQGCSPAGTSVTRKVPGGALPEDFGKR